MNVSSSTSLSVAKAVTSIDPAGSAATPDQPSGTGAIGARSTTNISGPGRLFQQLKQLHDSDPAKFKQVMSSMADSLRADAKSAQGDDASRLSALADRLDKVAQSGNLADMASARHAGGQHGAHGHHHGHGGGTVMSDLESAFNRALSGTNDGTTASPSASQVAASSAPSPP